MAISNIKFCEVGLVLDAQNVFEMMVQNGVQPDVFTYSSLIDGFCSQSQMDKASRVFQLMIAQGCEPNVVTYNTMFNGYCKQKRVDEAVALFHEMKRKGFAPEVVTYNTLISGFCHIGRIEDALQFLKEMREVGHKPEIITLSTMLYGFCKVGQLSKVMMLFKEMKDDGLELNIVVYTVLINAFCSTGALRVAFSSLFVHQVILPNLWTYNSLIGGLRKRGILDEAFELFRQIKMNGFSPDGISYNILIRGFLCNKGKSRVMELINEMVTSGFAADDSTTLMVVDLLEDDPEFMSLMTGSESKGFAIERVASATKVSLILPYATWMNLSSLEYQKNVNSISVCTLAYMLLRSDAMISGRDKDYAG